MIIGITGGIGSGKSTIARALAQCGHTVYDCDAEAKRIIAENEKVQKAIIALLGTEAFADGHYNTAYVAQRVFGEPELLDKLNHIVHPEVLKEVKGERLKAKGDFFIESAILYEAGLNQICSKIIVVQAPEEVRIERTIARDFHGEATESHMNKVRARIRVQGDYAHPTALPTLYINNDGQTPIPEIVEKITHWMCKN